MTRLHSKTSTIQERPASLVLELSRNCNLKCSMCGFGGQTIVESFFMQEDVLRFLDDDFLTAGLEEIRLNGRGESTLHPKFCSILRNIRADFPTTRLTLFTNMMMPDSRTLTWLRDANVETYVSVDSANPKTYENIRKGAKFRTLMERLLQIENGIIVFTLQKTNFLEVEEIGRFAEKFGFGLIVNVLRTDDQILKAEFENALKNNWERLIIQLDALHSIVDEKRLLIPNQIWGRPISENTATTVSCGSLLVCPNILSEAMIGCDGTIFPCNMFNPETYGSLKSMPFQTIWNSDRHLAFLKNHKRNYYCKNCEYMIPKET
jgi:MoaA/NifB/PqqE/SkfB family radical SAM enzyme